MSDLLAVSYSQQCKAKAQQLFRQVCESMQSIKGIKLNDQAEADGVMVARFASALSPAPNVMQLREKGLILAAAGWCQVTKGQQTGQPVLGVLADEYLNRKNDKDIFSCLQGQYAAVCVEIGQRRMLGWVDRLGVMPGYVSSADGIAWFSTSAMALASVVKPQLDLHSVRTLFLGRSPNSPHSLFEGISRLGFGQHVELSDGRLRIETTWTPYLSTVRYRNFNEAIDEGVSKIRACCEGIRNTYPRLIMDFTSGLDSRLVVAGMYKGDGDRLSITVSGVLDNIDVQIAHRAAKQFGWDILPFPPPENWESQRWPFFQQGVALSEGELTGNRIDKTLHVKRAIREAGGVAVTGGGGELFREFFWQQEFFNIGRTSELNLPRLVKYRFDFGAPYEKSLFGKDWYDELLASDVATIKQIVDLAPDALNTAKLDAIYIWKSGGHVGRYAAAVRPVVFSLAPLLTQELIEYAVSMPWQYRMHGKLIRSLITRLSPKLAKLPTWYGSSAEPLSILRPLQGLKHGYTSAQKLIRKSGQVTIGRSILRDRTKAEYDPTPDIELTKVMQDEGMLKTDNLVSAGLYDPKGLTDFLNRAQQPGFTRHQQLQVLVSVELICRMCGLTEVKEKVG
jgi:asparagine synthetase B (glutamine-hydrolysing)